MLSMPMSRKDKGGSELLIYLGLFVTIFNNFSDCTEFTPSGMNLFVSSVVETPTNEVTSVQGRTRTTKMGHGRLLIGRNVLLSNTSSADGADLSGKTSEDFQYIDADYQSDMSWDEPVLLKGQTHEITKPGDAHVEDLLLLEPEVECSRESMKLKIFDRSTKPGSLFFIDRGNEQAPLPLDQLPPSCGHSMKFTQINLIIVAPFDGCYVSLEENDYVLSLRWSGLPLKMSCPAPRESTPGPPTVSCHSDGMVLNMGWTLSAQDIQVKFKEQWQLLMKVSSHCGFSVVTHPKGVAVSAPYAPCLETKDGMYSIELNGKGEVKASCPSHPMRHPPRDPNLSPKIPITSSPRKPVNPPCTLRHQHIPTAIASQIYPPKDSSSTPHHPKFIPTPQTSPYQEEAFPHHAVTRRPKIHTTDELVHKPFYENPFYPWVPLPEIPPATTRTPDMAPRDPEVTRPFSPSASMPTKSAGTPVPKFTAAVEPPKHPQEMNTRLQQPFYPHPFHTTRTSVKHLVYDPTSPQPDATQFHTPKKPMQHPSHPNLYFPWWPTAQPQVTPSPKTEHKPMQQPSHPNLYSPWWSTAQPQVTPSPKTEHKPMQQPSHPNLYFPWWPTTQPQVTPSPKTEHKPFHPFYYSTPQKTHPPIEPTLSQPAVQPTPPHQAPVKDVQPTFHPPSFSTVPSTPHASPGQKPIPLEHFTHAEKTTLPPSQKLTPGIGKPPTVELGRDPEYYFSTRPTEPEPTASPFESSGKLPPITNQRAVHPVYPYMGNPNDPHYPYLPFPTKPPRDHFHWPFHPNPFYPTRSHDPKPPAWPYQSLKPVPASPPLYPSDPLPGAQSFIPPVYCPQVCVFGFSHCCPVPISFHQHYHHFVPANVHPGSQPFNYPIFGYGSHPAFLPIHPTSNLNDQNPAAESKDANCTTGKANAAENFQSSSHNYWTKFASQLHTNPYDPRSIKPNFQHMDSSRDPKQLSESQVPTLAEDDQLFEPTVHHAGDLNKPHEFQIKGYPLYFPKSPRGEPSASLWPADSSTQQHFSSQLEYELYPHEESGVLKPRGGKPERSTQTNRTETAGRSMKLSEHRSTGSDAKDRFKPDRNRHHMLETFPASNHRLGQKLPGELESQPQIEVIRKLSKGQPLVQAIVPYGSLEPQPTLTGTEPMFIDARNAQRFNPPDYLNEDAIELDNMELKPTNLESFKHYWKPVFQPGSVERISSLPETSSYSQDQVRLSN